MNLTKRIAEFAVVMSGWLIVGVGWGLSFAYLTSGLVIPPRTVDEMLTFGIFGGVAACTLGSYGHLRGTIRDLRYEHVFVVIVGSLFLGVCASYLGRVIAGTAGTQFGPILGVFSGPIIATALSTLNESSSS
jgi:hypothetical protein